MLPLNLVAKSVADELNHAMSVAALFAGSAPLTPSPVPHVLVSASPTRRTAPWTASFLPRCGFGFAQAASDTDVQLRCEAVRALGAMGEAGVPHVEVVLAAIADGRRKQHLHTIRVALDALGAMGPNARFYAAEFAQLLRHREPTVRQCTVRALGQTNARAYLPAMVALLRDDVDAAVRVSAVDALVRLHTPSFHPDPNPITVVTTDGTRRLLTWSCCDASGADQPSSQWRFRGFREHDISNYKHISSHALRGWCQPWR
jgi:hypothetical protein